MRTKIAICSALLFFAPACRHGVVSNAKLRDVEVPGIDGAFARVVFEDRGKVMVRGCPETVVVPPDGVLTRVQCNVDLKILPLTISVYKDRLAKALSVRSLALMTKSEEELDRSEVDLARLQKVQLDIRLAGRVDDGTIIAQIVAVEARSLDLRAKVIAAKSRNAQFDRIMRNLGATTSTRLFGPGIDQQAALSPFEVGAGIHENIIVPGSCVKRNDLGMVFCDIPAGTFTMGALPNDVTHSANPEEVPEHRVTISGDFEMLSTEVTQAMWNAVMGRNPSQFIAPGNPVEKVTYEEVTLEFIPRLNARLKADGYLYRLPTEAEWEYACRARHAGDFGVEGDVKGFAWLLFNSDRETSPVGRLRPNAFGLFDMHGNVRELVQDAFARYSDEARTDPLVSDGDGQISRGGGWRDFDVQAKCASRGVAISTLRDEATGLRLVRNHLDN